MTKYTCEKNASGAVLKVSGEIDISNAQAFKLALNQHADTYSGDVQVDCNLLTYIDSQGLNVFAQLLKKLNPEGRNLILIKPCRNVKHLLEITQLDKYCTVIF